MTYIPESSRYMSRKKLAMTLGVKAARTEWILLTEATTKPSSRQWLRTMTRACDQDARMVIGYGGYADEASSFKRFERLYMAYYLMREDSHGQAYRTLSHNLLLRKSDFMASDGFLGSLNLIRGEYDFKKNLEAKTKLCEEAEALDKVPDVVSAFHQLQELHAQYREIGPVAKDLREQIWARFKAASTVINKKHQKHFEELRAEEEENLTKKTELCEKVEELAKEENKGIGDWEKHSKAIIALQKEWKTIGFAPQSFAPTPMHTLTSSPGAV